jgi:benzoate 4-monooxygenase
VAPESVVKTLPLLNATLKETMRLRPTSSTGLERIVPPGGQEIAGKFFAAGVNKPT